MFSQFALMATETGRRIGDWFFNRFAMTQRFRFFARIRAGPEFAGDFMLPLNGGFCVFCLIFDSFL